MDRGTQQAGMAPDGGEGNFEEKGRESVLAENEGEEILGENSQESVFAKDGKETALMANSREPVLTGTDGGAGSGGEKRRSKKGGHFQEESKQPRRPLGWIGLGLVISAAVSLIFVKGYDLIQSYGEMSLDVHTAINGLYRNNLLLYGDLYDLENGSRHDYREVYRLEEKLSPGQKSAGLSIEDLESQIGNYFDDLEGQFQQLNRIFDYFVKNKATGVTLTNTLADEKGLPAEKYYFLLTFSYDENGNATIGNDVKGEDSTDIRKTAIEIIRHALMIWAGSIWDENGNFYQDLEISTSDFQIQNCEITYGISYDMWNQIQSGAEQSSWVRAETSASIYHSLYNEPGFILLFPLSVFLLAIFLPSGAWFPVLNWADRGQPWRTWGIFRLPLEIAVLIGLFLCGVTLRLQYEVPYQIRRLPSGAKIGILVLLLCLLMSVWCLGILFRGVRRDGIRRSFQEKSLVFAFFRFLCGIIRKTGQALSRLDLTGNVKKTIWKLLFLNAVILSVICCFWIGGMVFVAAYTCALYFLLKKYVGDFQRKFRLLLDVMHEIAQGNLNGTMTEDLGVFEPFKPQVALIQGGFRKAVEEEMKSQRMKTELITNVSHDLKTPLTAIITYLDLLKEESLEEGKRKEYLDILENKSFRLKILIEDLFEVSRAVSRNVSLNIVDVDIMNLVRQVALEASDQLEAARLDVRLNLVLPESKLLLPLDSQKTYRVYENLFANIAKYALPGTRVYVDGFRRRDQVVIILKNIAAQEIQASPEELTERFVRGDVSRNTEGSGLGLSIAMSFMEVQGGKLHIEVDGDLFKATTVWTLPQEKAAACGAP
ncbi:MAG: sensor histidine kinase [Clostridium sp.]|jgi:signal transduction histidine kinase|nr:sensor histidine kinase [Clostridium sp.]